MVKTSIQIDIETENVEELKNELMKMVSEFINPKLLDSDDNTESISKSKESIDTNPYFVPISDLGFSTKTRKALAYSGILSVGDILEKNAEELLQCPRVGVVSFYELIDRLKLWAEKNKNASVVEWVNREYDYYERFLKKRGDDEIIKSALFNREKKETTIESSPDN